MARQTPDERAARSPAADCERSTGTDVSHQPVRHFPPTSRSAKNQFSMQSSYMLETCAFTEIPRPSADVGRPHLSPAKLRTSAWNPGGRISADRRAGRTTSGRPPAGQAPRRPPARCTRRAVETSYTSMQVNYRPARPSQSLRAAGLPTPTKHQYDVNAGVSERTAQ